MGRESDGAMGRESDVAMGRWGEEMQIFFANFAVKSLTINKMK